MRDQVGAGKRPIDQIAGLLRRVDSELYQAAAGADGLRPGKDVVTEEQVDPGLEAIQPELRHEVEAELTKAEPSLVIAEQPSQHGAEDGIRAARSVGVAMLQAEIGHAAEDDT
ncbi:MAG TPA: hypothetical protein VJ454_08345, partial [Steroidobacteraceae bacterium]|nr:hypothetical protein [Steroidobacteraceae bacterium]